MPGPIRPFFYKFAYKREADFCREVLHLLTKYFQMLKLIKNFLFALYWQIQLKSNLREHPPLGSSHSREFVVSLYIDVAAVWPAVSVGSGRSSVSVDVARRNLQTFISVSFYVLDMNHLKGSYIIIIFFPHQ